MYIIIAYNKNVRQYWATKGVSPGAWTEVYDQAMTFPNRKEARAELAFIKDIARKPAGMRCAVRHKMPNAIAQSNIEPATV